MAAPVAVPRTSRSRTSKSPTRAASRAKMLDQDRESREPESPNKAHSCWPFDNEAWPKSRNHYGTSSVHDGLSVSRIRWMHAISTMIQKVRVFRLLKKTSKFHIALGFESWVRATVPVDQVARAIDKAKIDKNLDLVNMKLFDLPDMVTDAPIAIKREVKRMVLAENRLTSLPSNMFQHFTSLVNVRLANNRLTHLPPSIGQLHSLQILSIECNRLLALPPAIGDLVSLHTFYVNHNPELRRFPLEFGKLKHFSSKGCIKDAVYDVDRIRYPPKEVSLEGLVFACDFMNRMWESTVSGFLNLNGMGLHVLPLYLCEYPMVTRITELSFLQNEISRLPPEMGYMTNLNILRVDENSIMFPSTVIMRQSDPLRDESTKSITNTYNAPFMYFLRRIADAARSREIVLRGGTCTYGSLKLHIMLTVIAQEILEKTSCKHLDLSNNDIREIPPGIHRLTALTSLILDHNRLRYIPESFSKLTTLQRFSTMHNDVRQLPDAFRNFWDLVDLDLSHNKLGLLPPSIASCTNLTRLSLHHNELESLPPNLDKLLQLRYVYIGSNPLTVVPPELGASPYLTEVNADMCTSLESISLGVIHGSVPPRCPMPEVQYGASRFLCNAQRLARLLTNPVLLAELETYDLNNILKAVTQIPSSSFLRAIVQTHCEITEPTKLEQTCRNERRFLTFDPGDLLYSRSWRLSKAAQLRNMDAVTVNQIVAMSMPQMSRTPALVRYLWGLWGGKRLGVADLSGCGMTSICPGVLDMTWLTKLYVPYNRLCSLPDDLPRLSQLIAIDLGHNLLTVLPPVMGLLTNLREINLSYNMLDSLPKEMANLHQWVYQRDPKAMQHYETSWIEGNPISFPHVQVLRLGASHTRGFLKQVASAEQTGKLDFRQRDLPLFPDQLTEFSFLIDIDMSYNKIDRIPPAFTNMVQLQMCVLAGNSIDRLPTKLNALTSMQVLDLRDNKLLALPDSIGALHANLTRLLVGRNKLTNIPSSIGLLSSLQQLHLNWNQLSELPEEMGGCTELIELQLSYNKIQQLPGSFSKLTKLATCALQDNSFMLLPAGLGNMPNLNKLSYTNNPWLMPQQEVLAWPPKYADGAGQHMLSIGMTVWCRFQRLPRFRKARVDNIQSDGTFDVSFPFDRDSFGGIDKEERVPREVVEETATETLIKPLTSHQRLVDFMGRLSNANTSKELDLTGFHMTEFIDYDAPAGLKYILASGWYIRGLQKLALSHNHLATLPASISQLSSLTVLLVNNNALIALPQTMSALVCLKSVDVSYNHLTVLPSGLGMATGLERIVTHHNPLIAPPAEILRQPAKIVVRYLRGVFLARQNGKLDWNALGLFTIDTLLVMLPDGDAALVVELYLDDNLLVVLHPNVLRELMNLEVIRCCRNYLTTVHPSLAIWCPKLQQITFDSNRCAFLPHTIGALSALVAVSFDNNPHLVSPPEEVNALPSQIKIRYLRRLYDAVETHIGDMAGFELNRIPPGILDVWDLQSLDISSNKITMLNPTVCLWTAITKLSVANNFLTAVEANVGLCETLTDLNLSCNRIRRLPPEMGRLTRLMYLDASKQECSATSDINGAAQGYLWCTNQESVFHVHNLSVCTPHIYRSHAVVPAYPCNACLEQGRLDIGSYLEETIESRIDDYRDAELLRSSQGLEALPEPEMKCKVCFAAIKLAAWHRFPSLRCNKVRPWLPSRIINQNVWSPLLPASTFRHCYTRIIPGRGASDLRPVPNTIETPPLNLLDAAGSKHNGDQIGMCARLISYLDKCLAARLGELHVKGFALTQFPLEALDLSGLRVCCASDNCIKDMPNDLERLTNLETLHLDHNVLEVLPPGIRFLTALKELLLNDNLLCEICPEIGACTQLTKLNLHSNRLHTLPHTVGNCVMLTELTIQNNQFYVLPPSLSSATGLVVLGLDTDPAINCYTSPPNPIPQQGTFQIMRYLHEMYTYMHEFRLSLPGYELDFVPDLILEAASCVTALNLDQNAISHLPEAIGEFKLLKELLSLCDNRLHELPKEIGNIPDLQRLCLSGNFLTSIPDEICQLTNLVQLTLDHNQLTEIPRSLSSLSQLVEFTMVDNKITRVHSEFGLISSITKLGIDENPLVVPPKEVSSRSTAEVINYLGRIKVSQFTGCLDLANLKLRSLAKQLPEAYESKVLMAQNNVLSNLPEDFKFMTNLEELYLDGNPLIHVPDVVANLRELKVLSLEHLQGPLESFGNSIGGLVSLVVLRAPHNMISELPDQFRRVIHLEYMDLSNNRLICLPRTFACCTELRVLLLANNTLTELCKGMSGFHALHTIDVSHNQLTHLSRGLGSLMLYHALKNHYLSNNKWQMPPDEICVQGERRMLEYVGELWKSKLGDAVKLVNWNLSVLPKNVLDLRNIVELNLDENRIQVIPKEIQVLKKLQELSMVKNKLQNLIDELFNIQALTMLKFDDNRIESIPSSIEKLSKSLTCLSITQNRIKYIPVEFGFLEVLEIFQVNSRILEPDLRWAYDLGLDTLLPYLKIWKPVPSTGMVKLPWQSSMAWEALTKVPYQIWKYGERVRLINLNDNAIAELPERICGLENLGTLLLERNQLKHLPYGMCRLSSLHTLSLVDNALYDPPQEVVENVGLAKIKAYLEALYMAPHLGVLVLNALTLPFLKPHDLLPLVRADLEHRLYQADYKDSSASSRRPLIADQLRRRLGLISITALSLEENRLTAVPEAVGHLTSLTLLAMPNNLLEALPDKFGEQLRGLRVLQLNRNKIYSLPESLGRLQHLVALHAADNNLATLPPSIARLVSESHMGICGDAGVLELDGLVQLSLRSTMIKGVPTGLCRLTRIEQLDLADCSDLRWPPPDILSAGLTSLLAYLRMHQEVADQGPPQPAEGGEEEQGVYDAIDARPGSPTAVMQLSAAAITLLRSLEAIQVEAEELKRERVKHVRMGNKSNIAAIDARLAALKPTRQELAGKLQEVQDGQGVEEELALVMAELNQLDSL